MRTLHQADKRSRVKIVPFSHQLWCGQLGLPHHPRASPQGPGEVGGIPLPGCPLHSCASPVNRDLLKGRLSELQAVSCFRNGDTGSMDCHASLGARPCRRSAVPSQAPAPWVRLQAGPCRSSEALASPGPALSFPHAFHFLLLVHFLARACFGWLNCSPC